MALLQGPMTLALKVTLEEMMVVATLLSPPLWCSSKEGLVAIAQLTSLL